MDKNEWKHAQRELDHLLQTVPERIIEIYETLNYDATMTKLKEVEAPRPDWVVDQVRILRVKNRTILAAEAEMARELNEKLERYTELGGLDPERLAHARELQLFLQKSREEHTAQREQLQSLGNNLSLVQQQEDLIDRLEIEQLRKRIRKS